MDLLIDRTTNDLVLEAGELAKVEDAAGMPDETRQRVRMTFRALKGEYHLDTTFGFPYLQIFGIKDPDMGMIAAIARATAMTVDTIKRVISTELELDHGTRELAGTIYLSTEDGKVEVEI